MIAFITHQVSQSLNNRGLGSGIDNIEPIQYLYAYILYLIGNRMAKFHLFRPARHLSKGKIPVATLKWWVRYRSLPGSGNKNQIILAVCSSKSSYIRAGNKPHIFTFSPGSCRPSLCSLRFKLLSKFPALHKTPQTQQPCCCTEPFSYLTIPWKESQSPAFCSLSAIW